MTEGGDDQERESAFLAQAIDPIARAVLDAPDAWAAYNSANGYSGALADDLDWLPHGGSVYRAWAELTDLYETGKTPIGDAHSAIQDAATSWLDRSVPPDAAFIESWLAQATDAANALVTRDGDFWRSSS